MLSRDYWNENRITGALLVAGFVVLLAGVYFFIVTEGKIAAPVTQHMAGLLEGSLVSAGMMVTALGFALFEGALREAGNRVLSRLGTTSLLMGTVLWLVVEAISLDDRGWIYPLEKDYIILSCFSMACYGGALLRTRLLPRWVALFVLAWGVVWLGVGLVTFIAPLVANLMQLLIGLALLVRQPVSLANRAAEAVS